MSTFVKSGGFHPISLKTFLFSILFSLFLIGCGGGGGGGGGGEERSLYTISFLDNNWDIIASASKPSGNVNISEVADEVNVLGAIYDLDGVVVRGSSDYEAYDLKQDVNFYTTNTVKSISNQAELEAIRTGLGGRYVLTDDINLTIAGTTGWQRIGVGNNAANRFTGRLNGNGYTIRGLWTSPTSGTDDYFGLFGYLNGAHIINLNIEIADGKVLKGADTYTGVLAGYATGSTISNVHVKGNVVAVDEFTGGIVGYITGSTIADSSFEGNINGEQRVGGIVGQAAGSTISNVQVRGDVIATNTYAGGVVGQTTGASTVVNSNFEGNINGTQYVGGVVGRAEGTSTIKNSHFAGVAIGTNGNVGGISGYITGSGTSIKNSYSSGIVGGGTGGNIGGIAGEVYTGSSILNSYSNADVVGYGANTGGIAGRTYSATASVKNSYALGNVNGTTYVGGIVGRVYTNNAQVQKNAAINPSVVGTGNTYKNRVVSGNVGGVSNNFALDTMNGTFTQSTNPANHGLSRTVGQLTTNATYIDELSWAFGNDDDNPWVWDTHGISSYPYPTLYWE
jgi:hypothetical protein